MILAKDAKPRAIYRRTRGDPSGTYYVLHRSSSAAFLKRCKARFNALNGREVYLMAMIKEHPDWPLFVRCTRGTDHFAKRKYETKEAILLDPETKLRELAAKPGYSNPSGGYHDDPRHPSTCESWQESTGYGRACPCRKEE